MPGCRRDRTCRDSLRMSRTQATGRSGALEESPCLRHPAVLPNSRAKSQGLVFLPGPGQLPPFPFPSFASHPRSGFPESPERAREGSVDPDFHHLPPNPAKKWRYLWEMDENTEMSPRTRPLQYFFSVYKGRMDLTRDVPANLLRVENPTTMWFLCALPSELRTKFSVYMSPQVVSSSQGSKRPSTVLA